MEKASQGKRYIDATEVQTKGQSNYFYRTPYGLNVSLPNKERGILHIEKGNYWKFYNLEYALPSIHLRLASSHFANISPD
jgi:hypothetical protein